MKILKNSAKCRACETVVTSDGHEEAYRYCDCKKIAVKGGTAAILRLGHHRDIIEMSEKDYSY